MNGIENGFTYELRKSTSFKGGSWYRAASQSGSTATATFTDSAAIEPKAFYKIIRK